MPKHAKILIIAVILFITAISLCTFSRKSEISTVIVGGKEFVVDLANTDAKREKGLSGSSPLDENSGMLFVFDKPGNYGFWMKDMLYPIDIIWIGSDMKVTGIEKSLSPNTYPTTFSPGTSSLYVLEVASGQSQTLGLEIGDSVKFLGF